MARPFDSLMRAAAFAARGMGLAVPLLAGCAVTRRAVSQSGPLR